MAKVESVTKLKCFHCGDPIVGANLVYDHKDFCCVGCKGVYTLLSENNLCDYYQIDENPGLILDLKEEIQEECEKLGQVTSITVYDENPEGIVAVRFRTEAGANACVKVFWIYIFKLTFLVDEWKIL